MANVVDDKIDSIMLCKAAEELEAAMQVHRLAEEKESAARSEVCSATNRLNEAQRDFDKAVAVIRGKAPWNSDWRNHNPLNPMPLPVTTSGSI